jgi:hypothetical protein
MLSRCIKNKISRTILGDNRTFMKTNRWRERMVNLNPGQLTLSFKVTSFYATFVDQIINDNNDRLRRAVQRYQERQMPEPNFSNEAQQHEGIFSYLLKMPFRILSYPFKSLFKWWYPDPSMAELSGQPFIDVLRVKCPVLLLDGIYDGNFKDLCTDARKSRVPMLLVVLQNEEAASYFGAMIGEETAYLLKEHKYMIFGVFKQTITDPNLLESIGDDGHSLSFITVSVQRGN